MDINAIPVCYQYIPPPYIPILRLGVTDGPYGPDEKFNPMPPPMCMPAHPESSVIENNNTNNKA